MFCSNRLLKRTATIWLKVLLSALSWFPKVTIKHLSALVMPSRFIFRSGYWTGSQFSKTIRIPLSLLTGALEVGTRFCLELVKLFTGDNKAEADTNEGLRAEHCLKQHWSLASTELAAEPIVLLLKIKKISCHFSFIRYISPESHFKAPKYCFVCHWILCDTLGNSFYFLLSSCLTALIFCITAATGHGWDWDLLFQVPTHNIRM